MLPPPKGSPIAELRVLLEVRSLDRGGMERMVASLARGIRDEGIWPVVVCSEKDGHEATLLRGDGIRVEVLTRGNEAAEMEALLDYYDIDLLNAHYSSFGIPLAAARGIPTIVTLHNVYAWLGAGILDEMRTVDSSVTHYIAVSECVRRFSCERFAIAPHRISVIRNGVVQPRSQDEGAPSDGHRGVLRRELGIADDAELVVQVGRVERVKCQLALVDAVARLAASRPRLLAWIAGGVGDADYAEIVENRIKEEGLEGRVVLVGERSDVPQILAAADTFVAPSIIEGLSLAAIEALRAGLPSVLTRTGDADYLLGANDPRYAKDPPGALIDGPSLDPHTIDWHALREIAGSAHPPHAAALASALDELLDHLPERRRAAARRGSDLDRELTVEEMARRTSQLYLRVASAAASQHRRRATRLQAELNQLATQVAQQVAGLERTARYEILGGIQTITAEVSTLRGVAVRTLDKLRLAHRMRAGLASVRQHLGLGNSTGPGESPHSFRTDVTRSAMPSAQEEPRRERWLVLAPTTKDAAAEDCRAYQLATQLAHAGRLVTLALRGGDTNSTSTHPAGGPGSAARESFERVERSVTQIRAWLARRDESLRVLAAVADREALEIARLAAAAGARILYDKQPSDVPITSPERPEAAIERDLRDLADDLIAASPPLAAALESPDRPVHVVPSAAEGAALPKIAARPLIAVVVLCYNNRDVIEGCVESLVAHRGDLAYDVLVVDNGSRDGSYEWLVERARRGDMRVLRNARNGCSSGRNLGIDATRSELVAFLDSDQRALRSGWLDPALEILREHRRIGAVGWNAGWFHRGTGGGTIVDDLPARGMCGRFAGARYRTDVAFLATSGLVVPRAVLARTARFDEYYDPTCFEDTDLSFQIKEAGYEIAYCPSLAVDHRPHATTGTLDGYSSVYKRNESYFLDKWRHRPDYFFDVPPH